MALYELMPTISGLRDSAQALAVTITNLERDADLTKLQADFSLGEAATLRSIAQELQAQLDTADRRFTIAVVGAFKVGKSTFLNALLGLHGDMRLSTDDLPDTACSTLIRFRAEHDPEARVKYLDGQSEEMSWQQARNLTSQVWLEAHPEDARRAQYIHEVEYFVHSERSNPILAQVNINDLPGTGSRYWREHTELTHRKMKEADAIIWVVSEEEPSAADLQDLSILRECASTVIPVINVLEDPSVDMERDESAVRRMQASLNTNFRHFFRPDIAQPLTISARVIELEQAKAIPDESVLTGAGYYEIVQAIQPLFVEASDPAAGARLHRISGATKNLAGRIADITDTLQQRTEHWLGLLGKSCIITETRSDEIESIHLDIRAKVRVLAQERSARICQIIAGQARNFIEDTLQLSNVKDIAAALKRNGRDAFEQMLKRRFLDEYLKMNADPNWLTEIGRSYGEDVRAVILPAWRRLLRKVHDLSMTTDSTAKPMDLNRLGESLFQAIVTVITRVVGILIIAGILAAIPGAQVIDAIGLLALIILSALTDPLAGHRRRAVDRARLQIEAQQYEIENNLLEAGMEGNAQVETEVRNVLQAETDAVDRALNKLRELTHSLNELRDRCRTTITNLDTYTQGVAV